MARLARTCFQRRRWVLLVWILAVVIFAGASQAVGATYSNNFSLPKTDSTRALDLLQTNFKSAAGDSEQIVVQARQGTTLQTPQVQQRVNAMLQKVDSLPHVTHVVSPYSAKALISKDGTIGLATVSLDQQAQHISKATADLLVKTARSYANNDLNVQLDGQAVEVSEQSKQGASELLGFIFALIILYFAFRRSLLSAVLPLISALIAILTGTGIIGLLTHVISVPEFGPILAVLVALGVGIDYALFIVTRHRKELLAGRPPDEAAEVALNTSGRAVFFAGCIVCIALLGMFALQVSFLYGVALSAAFVVALTMLASLTLLPAMLGFFGYKILPKRERALAAALAGVSLTKTGQTAGTYWTQAGGAAADGQYPPGEDQPAAYVSEAAAAAPGAAPWQTTPSDPSAPAAPPAPAGPIEGPGFWDRWALFVEKRSAILSIAAVVVIVVLALPFFSMRLGLSDAGSDAKTSTSRQAYDLLAKGFGPGFNGPFSIVGEIKGSDDQAHFAQLLNTLTAEPGVASVLAPRTSPNGAIEVATLYPDSGPSTVATGHLLHQVRDVAIPQAEAGSTLVVHVGGITAGEADFSHVLSSKLPQFVGVVVLLAFILLMIVFRSLVIPLTASIMNLLSIGAAMGVMTAAFQYGWGKAILNLPESGPIDVFVPVLQFAILFGLSMDYEVFLVSRMHEEWVNTGDNRRSVTRGQAETGRVITAAALIMIFVFLSFIFGGQRVIKEVGVGFSAAIFLDAFVIRTVLVPSLMHLFGKSNWWMPKWLERLLPTVNVEAHDVGPGAGPGGAAEREPALR
jgi:RND superfamily putative drug exporter